ncbi:MAG: hypothetical protein NTY45_07525 [Elusimicrobia bacterium]|nr:hypothetical protein [Elusimicrobiota bacterium]
MKKIFLITVAALAVAAGAAFAAEAPQDAKKTAAPKHDCANCPMHKQAAAKKCSGKMCPEKLPGVETVSKNTAGGIEITMTAKDKETIAKMQELTLVHYSGKENMCTGCPARVQGAETKIENTPDGVKVLITGKFPGIIKKIQEASAKEHMKAPAAKEGPKEAKAAHKYVCPMHCPGGVSDKPGPCPKCGMAMAEKK